MTRYETASCSPSPKPPHNSIDYLKIAILAKINAALSEMISSSGEVEKPHKDTAREERPGTHSAEPPLLLFLRNRPSKLPECFASTASHHTSVRGGTIPEMVFSY